MRTFKANYRGRESIYRPPIALSGWKVTSDNSGLSRSGFLCVKLFYNGTNLNSRHAFHLKLLC